MDGAKLLVFTNPLENGRATREHDKGVQILADANGALHDEKSVVESAGYFINEIWLDRHFNATETFGAHNDDVFRLGTRMSPISLSVAAANEYAQAAWVATYVTGTSTSASCALDSPWGSEELP